MSLKVIQGPTSSSPVAICTPLAWSVIGLKVHDQSRVVVTNRVSCSEKLSIEVRFPSKETDAREIVKDSH